MTEPAGPALPAPGAHPDRPRWPARMALVGTLCTALLVIAAALAPRRFPLSREYTTQRLVAVTDVVLVALGIAAALGAIVILAAYLRIGRGRAPPSSRTGSRHPWWAYLLTYVAVLFLVVTLSRVFGAEIAPPDADAGDERQELGGREPPQEQFARPDITPTIVVVMTLGVVLVAGAVYVMTRDRSRPPRPRKPAVGDRLADEIDAGMDDLVAAGDARTAVIACYSRLEGVLATAGVSKRPSETPFELLERALRQHRVVGASAHRLTTLFEIAKFSLHPIGERERRDARAALDDVRSQLRAAS